MYESNFGQMPFVMPLVTLMDASRTCFKQYTAGHLKNAVIHSADGMHQSSTRLYCPQFEPQIQASFHRHRQSPVHIAVARERHRLVFCTEQGM